MARPNSEEPGSRGVDDPRAGMERGPEQAAHETAMREISSTLTNIEDTLARAKQARKKVAQTVDIPNLELALDDTIERLEATHKELFQRGYFGTDQQRLL